MSNLAWTMGKGACDVAAITDQAAALKASVGLKAPCKVAVWHGESEEYKGRWALALLDTTDSALMVELALRELSIRCGTAARAVIDGKPATAKAVSKALTV